MKIVLSSPRRAGAAAVLAVTVCAGSALLGTSSATAATPAAAPASVHVAARSVASVDSAGQPTDAASYADALIRAWGAGNRARASAYATPSVLGALFGYADPGGGLWRRTTVEGAAGTVYVTYRSVAAERTVTIGVSNVRLAQGERHDAYVVLFSEA